ncbi:hypothetical protein ACLOJK_030678 [Asimina triloba]
MGVLVIIFVKAAILVAVCVKRARNRENAVGLGAEFPLFTLDKFLQDMEREKPIRFSSQQLRIATDNFTHLLGSGGFGVVYKGIFSNGTIVAVKVLNGISNGRIQEQFMAEVSTIGRTHHFNLVRLYGFCFDRDLQALVYEYMEKGSLDRLLFCKSATLEWEKLYEIAVGTAKAIAYLHEECQQRIIHYDIKPGNILLDANFCPKVADFGLAKLCNREKTHMTMTCGRGTPGYAAPELWMPFPVTHKCDVYSYGMLLFEILGRRRNLVTDLPESQEWFPRWVWKRVEKGELGVAVGECGIEERNREQAERLAIIALWCVQYRPEQRPCMSAVVKMLQGGFEIQKPLNPFEHMGVGPSAESVARTVCAENYSTTPPYTGSHLTTDSSYVCATPTMRRYEIEMASSA